ncbi:LysR family transcriptional regulator [Shewanella woodyi]|uniref:Transcriptional regulator, LysR family n=1 Tax=Shewanella woodyi (strain ATCC 51908 / MS32) TaxID=392500 RepID=B1KND7_SHEWM|nr:LysR family transcriptional regulator [Shewanella woodyi]ACA86014.1 transcriptional regulator, LysR family [Shewanella woodyi ATCC 51908]
MNFKRLETFMWVAVLGNFRLTAEKMNTTQPSISARIIALEEELGVKLFERDNSPVSLTSKGQEILPYVKKIMHMTEQLKEVADENSPLCGLLRLGVSETIVHTWLPTFLNKIHNLFPKLDVEITVDVTTNLREGLLSQSLDLAFLMGPVSDSKIENVDLCEFSLIWVANPKLGMAKMTTSIEQLSQWPVITYARNTRPYEDISNKFRELNIPPPRLFSCSSLSACLRMVTDGIGVSPLPKQMINTELANGKLEIVDTNWVPNNLHFTASYPKSPYNGLIKKAIELALAVGK